MKATYSLDSPGRNLSTFKGWNVCNTHPARTYYERTHEWMPRCPFLSRPHAGSNSRIEAGRTRRASPREDADNNPAILNLLHEIRRDMNSLSDRVARLENSNHEVNRRETDMFNMAYGRTECDIRHRSTELCIAERSEGNDSRVWNVAT